MRLPFPLITLSLFIAVSASVAVAQPKKAKVETEADAEAAQQRTIAISLVSTLADEARSFKDQTRRARVLCRRAWEAAEIVDADAAKKRTEEMRRLENEGGPVVVRGGPDLRSEVLRLAAKGERNLG